MTFPPTAVTVYPSPSGGIIVGTNEMTNVLFPIIVESMAGDHYFHAYKFNGKVVWDVFLWHPDLRCPICEIKASEPAIHGGWQAGGDTVVYQDDHDFELAINTNSISLKTAQGMITFDNQGMRSDSITALSNSFSNCFAAFKLGTDGRFSMGISGPTEGMLLANVQLEAP